MNNIQAHQIVESQKIHLYNRKSDTNQYYFNSFEPSYSQLGRLSLNLTEEQSLSRIRSIGPSSTRSKGLNLSMKKQHCYKKQLDDQNNMFNPQNLQESSLLRRKTASTLVKTAHTIHYLGGSLSKSKQDPNKSKQASKEKNILNKNFVSSSHLFAHSLRQQEFSTLEKDSSFSLHKEKHYKIEITPPKQVIIIEQSKGYSQQSKDSKLGKVHQLKRKDFLRSSKRETLNNKNASTELKHQITFTPPTLKTSQRNIEIKSKRQFLESYIQKPMINSIIVSGVVQNVLQEPESPVLRLKKRLEMNSLKCIYQKETLVSHEVHENKSSRIEVQQSVIVHRNVSQNIRPLMYKINLFSQGDQLPYKLYLGQQLHSNLILTVKQLPLQHFQKFAKELRIYQEVQCNKMDTKNILELIKHSTDFDKHLIIKEPFTQTLHDYLENFVVKKITRLQFQYVVESIVRIIKKIVDLFEEKGMVLKRKIGLNDFVFVFLNLKFQNLQMFELGNKQKVDKQRVLGEFRQELSSYFNRISSGSLDF